MNKKHTNNNFIAEFLNEKVLKYNKPAFIKDDPIQIPHLFNKKENIEISAFLTAAIAWGNRKMIIKKAMELMERMDNSPYDFIKNASAKELIAVSDYKYRTLNNEDVKYFVQALSEIYRKHKGLQSVFEKGISKEKTVEKALVNFRKIFLSLPHLSRTEKHVADVERNSAAKRLNLFLRWMVRTNKEGVDFGLWKGIKPSQLLIPLDIHSGNVARKLGLLTRKQNDFIAVKELMGVLKKFDPADPVKYDFALFGLGVYENF